MGAQGSTTINFGAFPGKSDASVVVTGQTGIVAGSLVEAWLRLADSADHLADEHWVETIRVAAGAIVAGTGFTIYARNGSQINEGPQDNTDTNIKNMLAAKGTRIYGVWSVDWAWTKPSCTWRLGMAD